MDTFVTTIMGMYNQFSATHLQYTPRFNTTLDHKYDRSLGVSYQAPSTVPALRYFGMGLQGYKNIDSGQGASPYPEQATNLDLYLPLPFKVVPVADDAEVMTVAARANYRMRVLITKNEVSYYAYFLKLIDWSPNTIDVILRDEDGVESDYDFSNTDPYLNPTPPAIDSTPDDGTDLVVRSTGSCEILGSEVAEAASILYGDLAYARISEIGLYTGCETQVTNVGGTEVGGNTGEGTVFNEAFYVQLAKHACTLGTDLSNPNSKIVSQISLENNDCVRLQI